MRDCSNPSSPGGFTTTEADAKKYYDENVKEFQVPEQVRASHILIRPADPNTDPNQAKAQAKHKAEELLKKVKGGTDFATVAKESSEDPTTKDQGGDLRLFSRGLMYPTFENAAFGLKVGQVSDLVETPFGYHIIKVTEHHDPNQIAFEKAKTDIISGLTRQKKQEAAKKYVSRSSRTPRSCTRPAPAAPCAADDPADPHRPERRERQEIGPHRIEQEEQHEKVGAFRSAPTFFLFSDAPDFHVVVGITAKRIPIRRIFHLHSGPRETPS